MEIEYIYCIKRAWVACDPRRLAMARIGDKVKAKGREARDI